MKSLSCSAIQSVYQLFNNWKSDWILHFHICLSIFFSLFTVIYSHLIGWNFFLKNIFLSILSKQFLKLLKFVFLKLLKAIAHNKLSQTDDTKLAVLFYLFSKKLELCIVCTNGLLWNKSKYL